MALTKRPNTLELARQQNKDGSLVEIVEVLDQTNAAIQDAPNIPGNEPMGNTVTYRSSLPQVFAAKINQGSVASKSSTEQIVDTIGMIDGRSEVDVKHKKINGEKKYNRWRWNEDRAFLQAIGQLLAQWLIYGGEGGEEAGFTGLALRMNAINPGTNRTKPIVIDAGGAGADNTSFYVVDWGEHTAHLIHPETMTAGISADPMGVHPAKDKNNRDMFVDVTQFLVAMGLSVEDRRHIGRVANVDVSDIATAGETGYAGPNLVNRLIDLYAQMPDAAGAQRVIYCNPFAHAALHKIAQSKNNLSLHMAEYLGKLTPHFQDSPIRRMDAISNAEARVV